MFTRREYFRLIRGTLTDGYRGADLIIGAVFAGHIGGGGGEFLPADAAGNLADIFFYFC